MEKLSITIIRLKAESSLNYGSVLCRAVILP